MSTVAKKCTAVGMGPAPPTIEPNKPHEPTPRVKNLVVQLLMSWCPGSWEKNPRIIVRINIDREQSMFVYQYLWECGEKHTTEMSKVITMTMTIEPVETGPDPPLLNQLQKTSPSLTKLKALFVPLLMPLWTSKKTPKTSQLADPTLSLPL